MTGIHTAVSWKWVNSRQIEELIAARDESNRKAAAQLTLNAEISTKNISLEKALAEMQTQRDEARLALKLVFEGRDRLLDIRNGLQVQLKDALNRTEAVEKMLGDIQRIAEGHLRELTRWQSGELVSKTVGPS